jgi:hypothetical protein
MPVSNIVDATIRHECTGLIAAEEMRFLRPVAGQPVLDRNYSTDMRKQVKYIDIT